MKKIKAQNIDGQNGKLNLDGKRNRPEAAIETGRGPKHDVAQIWNKFSARLGAFVRARVGDATAQDILQDVFLKLQKRSEEFRDPAKIEGWLFLVARNAMIDHYRSAKPMAELSEASAVESSGTEAVEIEELHAKLGQIINRLPKEYREAFVLTTFEGWSQEDLARHLGVSLSGAKSRVQRARAQLKEKLLEFCEREFSQTPGCQPCPRGLFPITTITKAATKQKPEKSK